jgi:DNA-binding NtrC family response regulator
MYDGGGTGRESESSGRSARSGTVRIVPSRQTKSPKKLAATGVLALPTRPYSESREKHDRAYFTALFEASHGNVSRVGKSAGLSRETVRTYLKALRIAGYGD